MNGTLRAREQLTASDRAAMLQLMQRHFEGVDAPRFHADLEQKNWAVLLHDDAGKLVGFSTLLLTQSLDRDRPITVICSGDTIVHPRAWRSTALPRTWIRAVRRLHAEHGEGPLWWLLITSGYRTYRFLPVFCRTFYPCYNAATPPRVARLMRQLATERYGDRYAPETGLVRFERPQRLRAALRDVPAGKSADPHVAHFLACNPGHEQGDELVSLAELGDGNLTSAGLRMLYGQTRQPAAPALPST
ncbi:MAG: hypothetical protein WD534_10405 [Phycisphaeraceae bacterium]